MKKLIMAAAVLAAATIMLATPASATSLNRVMAMNDVVVDDLNAISDAGHDADVEAMSVACGDLQDTMSVALTFTRPSAVPKAAWRHIRNAWRYMNTAGSLCEEGADNLDMDLIDQSTSLIQRSSDETDLATEAMS